ncbi:hypothetical protein [Piscinibacter sp.]|uniref:hypothetical protein n=1 Tax=Piscinibacter sp. TaxID=1903157 RepID=UPI0035B1E7AD
MDGRDRVTVDLRGAGPMIQQRAAAQGLTVAALVRRAVVVLAESPEAEAAGPASVDRTEDGALVKVTLRLPSAHALLLASRSRRAEVSQGIYVASLLEGRALPAASPDRREAIAALSRSTDQLAMLSMDLNGFMRLLGRVPDERLEPYRAGVRSLSTRVQQHLDQASQLLNDLQQAAPARRAPRVPRAKRP